MMKLNNILLPYLIKKAARTHGFLDPINVLAQLSRFGQPSEVMVPTELLRSGAVLQARGLINSQAIQHNLDWVWPYWVNRQFDPKDISFVPRAFSATHINLTHRNWTSVGLPDQPHTPIVDPRGLVMPLWNGWSVDGWIIDNEKGALFPSKLHDVRQKLDRDGTLCVVTESQKDGKTLISQVDVQMKEQEVFCRVRLTGTSKKPGWLVVSLRPYNPEGVSFIENIERLEEKDGWLVNREDQLILSERPEQYQISEYKKGDVARHLFDKEIGDKVKCQVGMATAAALFELKPDIARQITAHIPLESQEASKRRKNDIIAMPDGWKGALDGSCKLDIPDRKYQDLYETAITTLILHTADEAFAGPYTYKRFWFRDAIFIVSALLSVGLKQRAYDVIEQFPRRQKPSGYFASQEGEWDSNGQVLWVLARYVQMTGRDLDPKWKDIIKRGARWIIRKRLSSKGKSAHAGLMPSGFSAEHFGPNDYYYWDDFWSIAGLEAAAELMERFNEADLSKEFKEQAGSLMNSVDQSLRVAEQDLHTASMPASPYRRMDSGAIGSLAAGYPLQLWDEDDKRILATANYLLENCLVNGGFFHDMSHSGINPYLTLHIAQVLLRAGDMKFYDLMNAIAKLASPTGQWPEAIHPATGGGCMGDGQHVWAAAEWALMLCHCFVREDMNKRALILCSGVTPYWYANQRKITFGPAPTSFGDVTVSAETHDGGLMIEWEGRWHGQEPLIEVRLPGFEKVVVPPGSPVKVIIKPRKVIP